jgi:serine/threonine protein kinase
MSSSNPPTTPNVDMPVHVGEILAGKYQVEDVLGVGGMGVVVAAKHLQLEQKVALKFLRPEAMQSKEAVERFTREARSAVRLKSEHVAKVTDVGTLDTGAPYMVMEFLDGADLSRVVQATGSITIEESVHFVLQACEAIAEAHSLGIIHRDLKPQNLFVTRRVDGQPLVKVLDFGISKTLDTQSGLSLTRTSSIMGSPLYMSPEQMRSSKNVDQRSDIWALGVILYELLTGRVPFEAEAIPELCLKVVQDAADSPKSIRAEIPEGLSAVVLKCLEKNPSNRFANVAEFAAAIEPYSVLARGSSERIASTLNLPSRPPMVSLSSSMSASNPKIGTGGTAWGTTQAVPAKKNRTALIAVGAVGLVLVSIGVGVALKGATSKADTGVAATQTAPPVASTAHVEPAPTTNATPTIATQTTPTASSTPSTTQTTTTATPPRGTKTQPTQSTSTKPPTSTTKAAPAVTAPPTKFE